MNRRGAAGIRTPDLRRARAALSQLSYGPFRPIPACPPLSVGAPGLEPGTSALSGPRSNQLSYAPVGHVSAKHQDLPARCRRRSSAQGIPSRARADEPTSHSPPNGRPRRVASAVASGHRHPGAWSPIACFFVPGLTIGIIPRKEVIQPQLPLRLPCYDFVPITSPTLDSCALRRGSPTGFRCCRLS